jgi:hypothetical protein
MKKVGRRRLGLMRIFFGITKGPEIAEANESPHT